MKNTIYIDHQATTPVENAVLSAMSNYWQKNFGNPHSSEHIVGWQANAAVQKAAQQVGDFVGSEPDEVVFTSGATESNNLAVFSLCEMSKLYPLKQQILLTPIEHKCILNSISFWAPRFSLNIKYLRVNEQGLVDEDFLKQALQTPTLFCSIGLVNNEIGTIQNFNMISNTLREKEVYFHSDCAQAPKTLDCSNIAKLTDMASFSGHKIGGPAGIGALIISGALQGRLTPLIHGGEQQNGLRSGTLPLPLCVGLGEACALLMGSSAADRQLKTTELRDYFFAKLQNLSCNISLNGPTLSNRHVGNLNVSFQGHSGTDILMSLQPRVCASTGSACSSGVIEASHVLNALGLPADRASNALRFSFSYSNTFEELDEAISLILEKLN